MYTFQDKNYLDYSIAADPSWIFLNWIEPDNWLEADDQLEEWSKNIDLASVNLYLHMYPIPLTCTKTT